MQRNMIVSLSLLLLLMAAMWTANAQAQTGSIVGWGSQVVGVDLSGPFIQVAAGYAHSLGLKSDGSIVAWGSNFYGETSVPAPNAGFVAVAAGFYHSLGLKSDGSIVAWGCGSPYNYGQCNVPAPNSGFIAVAGGGYHSLGLKSDGSIVAWGRNVDSQTNVPAPNADFIGVAGGGYHSLGLKSDGSIVAWGDNSIGQTNVPAPNDDFIAVAAGSYHSLGLKSDGAIVAWGDNSDGQTNVPAPNADFIAVAAGAYHSLGLKSDGAIVAWGAGQTNTGSSPGYGQSIVPAPNADFIAVAAGGYHSLGLKSDGAIVAWGWNDDGQTNVPAPNAGFIAVAAGGSHSLGLKSDGAIVAWGWNAYGQSNVPAPNADFIAVAGGGSHSLAIVGPLVIVYVNASAAGLNNGTSWTNAFTDLQDALAYASTHPEVDEIWVARGTYMPDGGRTPTGGGHVNGSGDRTATFQLVNGVALYGGFFGGESSRDLRDPVHNVTILSGDLNGDDQPNFVNFSENSYHVVNGSGTDSTAVIDGLTVTAGNADGADPDNLGGGIYIGSGSPTITKCNVTANSSPFGGGGGLYIDQGNPRLTGCSITSNEAAFGGGVANDSGSPILIDCLIMGNTATAYNGGGVDTFFGGTSTFINCEFIGNTSATKAGGIYLDDMTGNLINCRFSNNVANGSGTPGVPVGGGAIAIQANALVEISNCTFVGNSMTGTGPDDGGGGILVITSSTVGLSNSILWQNTAATSSSVEDEQLHVDGATLSLNYSCVEGLTGGLGGAANNGSDPLFVDAGGGDLRLQAGSSAIDAADTTVLPLDTFDLDGDGITTERISLDLSGSPRILDDPATPDTGVPGSNVVDMGAYEYFSDCNGNGIPDACDLDCGAPDGPCDIVGCGNGFDCNTNDILDACDIADCSGDPACDDCNLNGRPDGCDIASGASLDVAIPLGVPDECVTANVGVNWSDDIWNLAATDPYPDNLNPDAVPGLRVTLPSGVSLLLDVTVEVNSLRVLNGGTLDVTQTGAVGDLFIAPSAGASAGTVAGPITPPPRLKLLNVGGALILADVRAVTVSTDAFAVGAGGVVRKQTGAGTTSASITAAEVIIDGTPCDTTLAGGEIALEDSMALTSTGRLIVNGSASVCPRTCSSALQALGPITPPPKLRVRGDVIGNIIGALTVVGAVDMVVDSTQPFSLGGNYDNRGVVPSLFDWSAGKLTLNGTAQQTFEVGGINLGQTLEGFQNDVDTLSDTCPHTNYSMGMVEVASGANVKFVNRFANTTAVGCAEALYVHELIFRSGSTVTVDNCKVYYESLLNEGVTPVLLGCGELLPAEVASPGDVVWDSSDTSPDRTSRSLRFAVAAPANATASPGQSAIKVTMIDLQNPLPANLPQFPPPNFSTYELASCADPGGCARWVGRPGTFYESQGPPLTGPYRAARLQCTPFYWDWISETTSDPMTVVGSEIVPSSQYSVRTYAASCKGGEDSCTNVSAVVTMYTRRSGDVDSEYNPPSATNQPNAIDVAQLVNKFKNVAGAPVHARAQLQSNLPELNASINALDIVAVVDAVKGFAYAFSGPCPCPSTVTCGGSCTGCPGMCVKTCTGGDNAGEPCINSNHCPGGTCAAVGTCRDNCGRCTP